MTLRAESLPREPVEAASDIALATGKPVAIASLGVIAVPDVSLLLGVAHGLDVPPTAVLRRYDGRSVSFYSIPEGWTTDTVRSTGWVVLP